LGKRFTVLKSFSEFKLFIFVRTFVGIRYRWALEFIDSPNMQPKIPQILGFGHRNLATLVGIQTLATGWNLANFAGI
jgi:hypothetical protein